MPSDKQRRENTRRMMQQQLQLRREREAARKKRVLISSVTGSVVAVVLVVVLIVVLVNNHTSGKTQAGGSVPTPSLPATSPIAGASTAASSPVASPSTTASPTPTPTPTPSKVAKGPSVSFDGVTVGGAADLSGEPVVTSKSSTVPTTLEYKDLVVGTGAAATPTSSVTVAYVGVLYANGNHFDASWTDGAGAPIQFSLTGVVPGFTQGIGGTTGVPPMKVGGRRIIIMPAALGYGSQAQAEIPANSPLVFVVDLKSIG